VGLTEIYIIIVSSTKRKWSDSLFLFSNFESFDRYYRGRNVLNQLLKLIFQKTLLEKNAMEFFEISEKVISFVIYTNKIFLN
jgi:hypothetical protein